MNLEDQLRRDLQEMLDAAEPPKPDLAVAMDRSADIKRRSARKIVGLVAASVVLILGGGVVVQQGSSGGGGERRDEASTDRVPRAPEGMRFVGMGDVVVAVPDSWTTNDTVCGIPVSETIYFPSHDADTFIDCSWPELDLPRGSLAIMSVDSLQGRDLASINFDEGYGLLSAETINGLAVKRGFHSCPPQAPFCPYASEVMVVPQAGVVFVVSAADERLNPTNERSDVLDSVRALPDDFRTVPSVERGTPILEATAVIEDAGLTVDTGAAPQSGSVLATDPPAGSVLAQGDVVGLSTEATTCGTGPQASPPPCGTDPVLTHRETQIWPQAGVSGALTLREGCLFVGDSAAVWPHGSTWDESKQAVQVGSETFRVGDPVTGSGGYYRPRDSLGAVMGDETWSAAKSCAFEGGVETVVTVRPDGETSSTPDISPNEGEIELQRQRVSLKTHCGVNAIDVDGQLWLASPPLRRDPDTGWGFNSTPGWFTVIDSVSAGAAIFEGDAGQVAYFRPAPPGTQNPNHGCK